MNGASSSAAPAFKAWVLSVAESSCALLIMRSAHPTLPSASHLQITDIGDAWFNGWLKTGNGPDVCARMIAFSRKANESSAAT